MFSSQMCMKQYTHRFVKEFIETYRSLPALWKIKSKEYSDRVAKAIAYEKLVAKFKEVDRYADRDTVKRKINSIRTTFRKEWRKVQNSKSTGCSEENVYKPSLWYYDYLLFLCDQHYDLDDSSICSPGLETVDNINSIHKHEVIHVEDDDEFFEDNSEDFYQESNNFNTPHRCISEWPMSVQPTSSSPVHFPSQQLDVSKEESIKSSTELSARSEDEFDYIAKTWAIKLRRMSAMQRLFAEKLVNDILFEGELGNLSRSSVSLVQPKLD